MNTLSRARSVIYLFSLYFMFFMIDNQRGILSNQIRQLPCRAREALKHITYFRTYSSAWTVLYMETFFLLSVNRCIAVYNTK